MCMKSRITEINQILQKLPQNNLQSPTKINLQQIANMTESKRNPYCQYITHAFFKLVLLYDIFAQSPCLTASLRGASWHQWLLPPGYWQL